MTNTVNRRKFLRGSAVAAAATLAAPSIARAEGTVLKMQAAWGGGIFLENAQSYVNRVNAMSGSGLKIELLSVDSVVKTSQMQDAVHRGVLDAAHYVPAYWYSKSKTASLFGTGPCFGWSSQEVLGWVAYGGGQELFDELMASLGLNIVSFFNSPMPAQPFGWFKEQIKNVEQIKGLKYRTVGLAADVLLEMGMSVVQLPGGINLPFSPEFSGNAALEYDRDLGNDSAFNARIEYTYQTEILFSQFTDLTRERQDGFGLLNASLRYDLPGGLFYVAVIGRNLGAETYLTQRAYYDLFSDLEWYGRPRTVEGRIGFKL